VNRIRGRKLQAIRARHFAAHPICVACEAQGRVRMATELDHVIALANGGKDEHGNRQGLCSACHKAKTAKDMGYKPSPKFDARGRIDWA
jgi:5-methylcytosine-specific restriction enzyme A